MNDPRIIVALDFSTAEEALQCVERLKPEQCRVKVGKELFVSAGPSLVAQLVERGFGVFLDLKFHDIPNTVAQACVAAARLGVWMINVHASGGKRMMIAAREAIEKFSLRPKLIAVTVLTSMDSADLAELGVAGTAEEVVLRLATLTRASGLDGVVCSALEAPLLRRELGNEFQLVTPGIRPADSHANDQSRVMTPAAAMRAGAHYLVIGRPITRADDPQSVLRAIEAEINDVSGGLV